MYLLKIESGNGYHYCQLPYNFQLSYCEGKLRTESIYLKLILSNKEHFNSNDFTGKDGDKKGDFYTLPKYIGDKYSEQTNENLPIPTFKVITYTKPSEDNDRVHYIESVVFDGRGYLIKENGKTIEKF